MKRCLASAALVMLLSATSVAAQVWRVDIPFAFHVGEVELSAGTYRVMFNEPFPNVVTVMSVTSTTEQASTPVFRDKSPDRTAALAKLVFNRYGTGEHFLSQICDSTHSVKAVQSGHELVTSKLIVELRPVKVVILVATR